jgi:hypothetical protein
MVPQLVSRIKTPENNIKNWSPHMHQLVKLPFLVNMLLALRLLRNDAGSSHRKTHIVK